MMMNDDINEIRIGRITKLRNKYTEKLNNWENNYQVCGTGSVYTKYAYEDIILACNLALENLRDECFRCKQTARTVGMLREKYKALSENQSAIDVSKVLDDLYSI